jgi:RES domain
MNRLSEIYKVKQILKEVNYATLTSMLDLYLPSVPICVINFDNRSRAFNKSNETNFLYRARLITNNEQKSYQNIEDITYISEVKKHKIKTYGRVNKPCEPMFYASTEMAIACLETFSKGENFNLLKEKKSLLLDVGVWKIEKPMTIARMISPEKYFERFIEEVKGLDLKKVTIETIRKQNEELKIQINNEEEFKILEFFSEEFAKTNIIDHSEYKISNYYADRIFNRNPKFNIEEHIDGIWYPSVPSSFQEINFALLPATVELKLKFLWCNNVWIIFNADKGDIQFITIEQKAKVIDNGIIDWKR